jgi:hypothetical protein
MKFQFKQSEFFVKRVAQPGLKFIQTGGKEGNILPLLLTLSPVGAATVGEATMDIKSWLNDGERPEHIGERLWENYMAIGGAGFFTQVADPLLGEFNPFKAKQLVGANVTDMVEFTHSLGIFMTEGEDDMFWNELMKDLTHPLPLQLRKFPRSFLRSLKSDENRQTQMEYDRARDDQIEDVRQELTIDASFLAP